MRSTASDPAASAQAAAAARSQSVALALKAEGFSGADIAVVMGVSRGVFSRLTGTVAGLGWSSEVTFIASNGVSRDESDRGRAVRVRALRLRGQRTSIIWRSTNRTASTDPGVRVPR